MGSVQSKKLKSGKYYYAVYITPNGKQRWERAGNARKSAEALLRRRELEIAEGTYGQEVQDVLFSQFYEDWFCAKTSALKETTIKSMESSFERHILPYFSDKRLSEITPLLIQDWINQVNNGNNISPATVGKCYRYLRSCLRQAYAWDSIRDNPCKSVVLPRSNHVELEFLEPEELRVLLSEAEEPYKTLYTLLALSGLRLGEALGLAWRHINFTGDFIQVERTWTFLGCFQSPKTPASRRAVPMLPTLSRVLRERYEELGSPKPDTLLFSYDGSQPVDQSNVRKDFLATLQRLGLRRVTPHSLRHSFASVMVASGASIKALQRCLGHSSASVTLNTYSHLIQENLGPALLRADELLGINDLGTTEQF